MRTWLMGCVAALVVAGVGRRCGAAVMLYSDRGEFEAVIGGHVTYTFDVADGFAAAPARLVSSGPVQLVGYLRTWPKDSSNQVLSGYWMGVGTGPIYVSFPTPQYAVGFDFYISGYGGWIRFDYESGFSVHSLREDDWDFSTPVFFGLISSDEIRNVKIQSDGDLKSQRHKGIDNLTIVPEPAGLLLLLPMIVLGWRRGR